MIILDSTDKALLKHLKNTNLYIKFSQWEFWPLWLAYIPVLPVFLFYVLKARRLFFFSNVNPKFETGAFLGASKFQILNQIPNQYTPISFLSKHSNCRFDIALEQMTKLGLKFPIIVKPDVGERGLLVELIKSTEDLYTYLKANSIDIIIQEYISLPNECGIFYIRKPLQKTGEVVSIGLKNFMQLKGDGLKSVQELMEDDQRFKLQVDRLRQSDPEYLKSILKKDQKVLIEPIGNHSRGTAFINGNHLKGQRINQLFDEINNSMEDVYYGRYDIKYKDWNSLLNGQSFKILELNGVASEPIHVYDNEVPIREKYKSFYDLWKRIYEISSIQKSRGYQPMSLKQALNSLSQYFKYMKSINLNWRSE